MVSRALGGCCLCHVINSVSKFALCMLLEFFFFSIPQRFGAVCVRACMCVCVWTKEEREFTLFLSHLISDLCYISLSKVV